MLTLAGAAAIAVGDRKLNVKTGMVTKILFPPQLRPYSGKLIGLVLLVAATLVLFD